MSLKNKGSIDIQIIWLSKVTQLGVRDFSKWNRVRQPCAQLVAAAGWRVDEKKEWPIGFFGVVPV